MKSTTERPTFCPTEPWSTRAAFRLERSRAQLFVRPAPATTQTINRSCRGLVSPIRFLRNFVIRGGYGGTSFFEGDAFNQRLTSSPPFALGSTSLPPSRRIRIRVAPSASKMAFAQQFNSTTIYSAWPQNQQPAYINEFSLTSRIRDDRSVVAERRVISEKSGDHLADYRNGNQLPLAQAITIAKVGRHRAFDSLVGPGGVPANHRVRSNHELQRGTVNPAPADSSWARVHAELFVRQVLTNSSGNYGTPNISGSDGAYQDAYNPHADCGSFRDGYSPQFELCWRLRYCPFGRGRTYGSGSKSLRRMLFSAGGRFLRLPFSILGFPSRSMARVAAIQIALASHAQTTSGSWSYTIARSITGGERIPSAISTNCSGPGQDDGSCAYGASAPSLPVSAPRASTRSAAPATARSTLPSSKTFTYQNVTSSDSGRTSSTFSI